MPFFVPPTVVQPPAVAAAPPAPLTQEEAVQTAVRDNPRLAAAVRDVRAARLGERAAGALANPNLVFTPALTGGVGGGSDTELLFQQPLEVNGSRTARRGAAHARTRRAEAEAVSELRSVAFAARSAYYELARAREQDALARTLLQTAEELHRIAVRQVELGVRPAIERTQTSVEATRARQQVSVAGAAVAAAEAALNAVMNRPTDAPVGTVALPDAPTEPTPSPQQAIQEALAQRTEIEAGLASADAFRQEARLTRAEGVPDLAPQYRAGSVTRGVQQSGFGVGVTLPFLDYGARRGRQREAEESARAEEERVSAVRAQIRQEVARALARVRAARDVLRTYPAGLLDEAAQLLRAYRIGYEEGKTGVVQLVEAQRTFRQVQNDFINAQVDYALALAELERATGSLPASLLPALSASAPRRTP